MILAEKNKEIDRLREALGKPGPLCSADVDDLVSTLHKTHSQFHELEGALLRLLGK